MPKYPKLGAIKRKPNKLRDGSSNYGKPCVVCGANTCGEIFIKVSMFRGEDELVRVCNACWDSISVDKALA